MYGSFKHPRELIWIFGMLLFVALMAKRLWIFITLGANVILGRTGHYFLV